MKVLAVGLLLGISLNSFAATQLTKNSTCTVEKNDEMVKKDFVITRASRATTVKVPIGNDQTENIQFFNEGDSLVIVDQGTGEKNKSISYVRATSFSQLIFVQSDTISIRCESELKTL